MTPDEYTNEELMLDVGDGHQLYIQDWGNQQAKTPIIFLHGGPGSGSKDRYKQQFDPETQRVIFFDQRGSGKSTPNGSLQHNTTQDAISDIEKIRQRFGFEQIVLTGGSWGSCLALAYALQHIEQVAGAVLFGIFTGSQAEIDWLDQGHWAAVFPDVWDAYLDATPEASHDDPSHYHFQRILGDDEAAAKASAYTYNNLEGALIQLDDRYMPPTYADFDYLSTRLEVHYLANRCFLPDRYILDNAHTLSMPLYLIQGRYDMVCPAVTAYELNAKLPNSELIWTINGHRNEHEGWNLMRQCLRQLTREQ